MNILKVQFDKNFGEGRELKYIISPLRICPLGAHVDYQHGLVTGMTLDANIEMAYSCNENGFIRVRSLEFPDEEYFHVDNIPNLLLGFWGVI